MAMEERRIGLKLKDFLETLLALKITEQERLRYAHDPYNIFGSDISNRRPLQVAAVLSVLFHILLFLVTFPSWRDQVFEQTEVLVLRQLARPAKLAGGGPPEEATAPPKPEPAKPKPEPKLIPIPDPTPHAPEPIRPKEIEIPQVVQEIAAVLNIGDINAPPGPPAVAGRGRGREGTGTGPANGPGEGAGDGGGEVFDLGSGITNPIPIVQTKPKYTDEAIRAKVQGVILLQAIIRKDGTVDSFRVLRPLGYGLEESAIREIATNWRFRPGTKDGRPVDVRATIEVTFNLR